MQAHSARKTIVEDLKAYKVPIGHDANILKLIKHVLYMLIFSPGFSCVFWYRVNRRISRRVELLAKFIHAVRFYTFANDISYRAEIGPGLKLCHVSDIVIGESAKIGRNCIIFNGVTIGAKSSQESHIKPTIGDNVYIGTGAKIIGGITVGNNVTIGALTFCNKSIPDGSVAYGNPMIIKEKQANI